MDRTRHGRFQRPDAAQRARQLRLCARRVELGAAAGVEPRVGDVQRFLLVDHVAAGDVQLLLLAAQFEVGARDFGRHGDQRVTACGLDRAELCIAGLERAARATEEIEFPKGVEAGVVKLAGAGRTGLRGDQRRALPGVSAAGVDGRREVESRVTAQCARFAHASLRDAQVVVGGNGFGDQAVESGVLEVLPELRQRSAGGFRLRGEGGRLRIVEVVRDLLLRRLVVGAHGAGGEYGRGKWGERESELGHCRNLWRRAGLGLFGCVAIFRSRRVLHIDPAGGRSGPGRWAGVYPFRGSGWRKREVAATSRSDRAGRLSSNFH